jgi:hypothetical protein
MKNKIFFIILSLTLTLHAEQTPQEEIYQEPLQEGLIIILDRSNSEFLKLTNPAGTNTCTYALEAHSPILVSKSILAHALLLKPYETKTITDKKTTISKEERIKEDVLNKWVIKELDDYYILVPKDKLDTLSNYLNITNLKEVSINDIKTEYNSLIKYTIAAGVAVSQEIFNQTAPTQTLNKLFLLPSKEITPMLWTVYLVGHGIYEGYLIKSTIADLSIKEFQELLNFLASKIKTKLLIYSSCYAGGSNKIKAFNDAIQKDITKTYPFTIIVLSITESVALGTAADFAQLFDSLFKEKYTLPNYYKILKDARFTGLYNFPQIRLPGSSWFSVEGLNTLEKNTDYVVISKVEGLARQKDMVIPNDTRAILVYTPSIPFKIKITGAYSEKNYINIAKFNPKFSFMAPGISRYHFAEIESMADLAVTLSGLSSIARQTPLSYLIYIDKLTCLYQEKVTTFSNCILKLAPYIFSTGYTVKLYANVTQPDGSPIAGEYTLDNNNITFATANKDYAQQFPPAPPFERLREFEKTMAEKTKNVALATKVFGKQEKDVGLKQLLEKK